MSFSLYGNGLVLSFFVFGSIARLRHLFLAIVVRFD